MTPSASAATHAHRRARALWLIALVTVGPLLISAFLFFVVKPGGKPAYGNLVQPQRPVPDLQLRALDGRPVDLRKYDGYWLMVVAAPAACDKPCQSMLYDMRQFAMASGEDAYRVARVWLVTDDAPVNPGVLAPAAGTMVLRANPDQLRRWLPLAAGEQLQGPMWLVDPLGHLMLRFPARFDPLRALDVFKKLLYNTQSWKPRHLEPLVLPAAATSLGAR